MQMHEPSTDRMDAKLTHTEMSSPRISTILLSVAVLLVGVLAIIGLVFSAISLARPGTTSTEVQLVNSPDGNAGDVDKIWVFAIGHSPTSNLAYIHDLTGTVRGFHIDIVEAVCAVANKNCQIMWDVYENCYKSKVGERPRPGVGLVSRWYDGCTGWGNTYDRAVSFSFTDAFQKSLESAFYVRQGNPLNFNGSDITGKTIGFMDGYASNEICLKRVKIMGGDLPTDRIRHFTSREDAIEAVNTGTVDAVFTSTFIDLDADLDAVQEYPAAICTKAGDSIMVRKDSNLPDWWNPAFRELKQSSEYRKICSEVTEKHGDVSTIEVPCLE